MAKQGTGIPKGTRDFSPLQVARREFVFEIIRNVYQLHGFMPIETPAMENLSTLMGKYGEEGDRLIFRILNSGDFPGKVDMDQWMTRDAQQLSSLLCEKALRYDLTVPFARYVVQHQHAINFPFKRYQIQPVWRADKPQKGRYREFFQCDADVIGSDDLINEVELLQIIDSVFSRLGVCVEIRLNNRKILAGLADHIGCADRIIDLTVAIDKMDKIGLEKVCEEMLEKGFSAEAVQKIKPVLTLSGSNQDKLQALSAILMGNQVGMEGIAEVQQIFQMVSHASLSCDLILDLTLARGLNYYTGAIIEVKAKDVAMGSICGGGRYDDLTGIFGMEGMSGVGISFGADRIYDVMDALDLFPPRLGTFTQLLAINFGDKERDHCFPLLSKLRAMGIRCELYPSPVKMKKQMQYANKNQIPFVMMVGEKEMETGLYAVKDMESGKQESLPIVDIPNWIKSR